MGLKSAMMVHLKLFNGSLQVIGANTDYEGQNIAVSIGNASHLLAEKYPQIPDPDNAGEGK